MSDWDDFDPTGEGREEGEGDEEGREGMEEFEEETKLVAEVDWYTRVGVGELGGTRAQTDIEKRIERRTKAPIDRFRDSVDAVARMLNGTEDTTISEGQISKMLDVSRRLDNVGRKNPTAFVLGYIASNGGHTIKPDVMRNVIDTLLVHVEDVAPEDVIRYARYWKTIG
jgi:hypothetical protein